ncbi:response regulator [Psychromonas sp. L1A2]|uniref:response regulator n=1 Tax=Psychromonas sp. L1A2 TaxID=2686356 RepID=UPI001357A3BA|nr:response regulator [Psychromonas sp. L1A2]
MFHYHDKKILIVDDQKAFHVMLKAMLTNQGAKNITFADTIDQAVKITKVVKFDIYLLDYNLGSGKNGVQLLDYLKKNNLIPDHALCFIITGDSNKRMVLTAIEKSPDDYLMKPFSPVQLSTRLTAATHRKVMLHAIYKAISDKHYELAISLCKQKIDQAPEYRNLCKNLLAEIYIQIEDFQSADKILKPLIELRPLVRPCISLGRSYFLQKEYKKSIEVLTRLIEDAPLQMEAYRWLARSYKNDGQLNNALNILTQAANTTHHSIERHQEVALLANEMEEYIVMLNSYYSILHLSRSSFYPDPCHLANYLRSIINLAKQEKDIGERKHILKKVSSALYQSRFEEGKNKDFNFNGFDEIYQANVHLALNEPLKAKRRIFNTLKNTHQAVVDFDTTFLMESSLSLLDIGEFDEAEPLLEELEQRHIIDPTTAINIKKHTGDLLTQRIENFKGYNKAGIEFFTAKRYQEALDSFERALILEPLNSGAILNRAQVFIHMLQENPANKDELITQFQNSIALLNNTHLPEMHAERLNALRHELKKIKGVA